MCIFVIVLFFVWFSIVFLFVQDVEWFLFGNDGVNIKYLLFDQIDWMNFEKFEVVWIWELILSKVIVSNECVKFGQFKVIFIQFDGLFYVVIEVLQVVVIDLKIGKIVWEYDFELWKVGCFVNFGF